MIKDKIRILHVEDDPNDLHTIQHMLRSHDADFIILEDAAGLTTGLHRLGSESFDLILLDDNFATIVAAVKEGRRIYDNLRKSVVFLLPTNGAQSLVILVAVVFGLTLPLARTEAVTMLALGQLAYLLNCRFLGRSSLTLDVFRGNPAIGWSALALIVFQLIYTYVPFMNALFGSEPLTVGGWLLPIAFSVGIFLAVEVLKAVRRRADESATAARFNANA